MTIETRPPVDNPHRHTLQDAFCSARHRVVSVATFLAVAFVAATGSAQSSPTPAPDAVEERFQRGIELRKQGRDAEALEEFRAAYEIESSPRIRAQIAVAEQALGQWVEAERELVLVLAVAGDPWIEERRGVLEQALARVRSRLGSLMVQSNIAGAELRIDGARVAALPITDPVRVIAGTHQVEVTAPGYAPVQRSVSVAGSGRAQEAFLLAPLPAAQPAAPQPAAVISTEAQESTTPKSQPGFSTRTWIFVGASGALLATGAVALAVREINVAHYNDGSRCLIADMSREEQCGSYRDAANSAEIVAITAFSAAGLAAIAAAFSLTNDIMKEPRQSTSLRCAPVGWGVGCNGRF